MRCTIPVLVSAFALAASPVLAGVVVTATGTDLADNSATVTAIYLDADRMKVADGERVMIYRGDLKRMWTINAKDRSYIEITPDTMKQMQDRMAGMRAQMEARLAQMPPDQRAKIEAMMKSHGLGGLPGAAPQEKIDYVKSGVSKTVGAWRCDVYSKMVNGEKEEDLCVAPMNAVGISAGDFQAMKSVSDMMGSMTQQKDRDSGYFGLESMSKAIGFPGIPIETILYGDGKPDHKTVLNKVDRVSIPGNAFDLPAGFTKKEFGAPR